MAREGLARAPAPPKAQDTVGHSNLYWATKLSLLPCTSVPRSTDLHQPIAEKREAFRGFGKWCEMLGST